MVCFVMCGKKLRISSYDEAGEETIGILAKPIISSPASSEASS